MFWIGLACSSWETSDRMVQGVYSPSEIDSKAIISYESGINNLTGTVLQDYKWVPCLKSLAPHGTFQGHIASRM